MGAKTKGLPVKVRCIDLFRSRTLLTAGWVMVVAVMVMGEGGGGGSGGSGGGLNIISKPCPPSIPPALPVLW